MMSLIIISWVAKGIIHDGLVSDSFMTQGLQPFLEQERLLVVLKCRVFSYLSITSNSGELRKVATSSSQDVGGHK